MNTDRLTEAQNALHYSQARFESLFEVASDAMTISDAEGIILEANSAYFQLFGYSAAEVIGHNFSIIFPEEQREWAIERFKQTFNSTDNSIVYESNTWHKDGSLRRIQTRVSYLSHNGQRRAMLSVIRDITAQQKQALLQKFLIEAGKTLSSSLDYELTLTTVAQLATPQIADWCAVDLIDEHGHIQRVAVTHVDPDKVRWAYELQRKYPPSLEGETGFAKVIRTGQSDYYPRITDDLLVMSAREDAELLKILRELDFRSSVVVPLTARGRTFGGITLVTTGDSGRFLNAEDVALAEEWARIAALAVDNARLYEAASATQSLLQSRVKLQSLISELGQEALVTFDLPALMKKTGELLAQTLNIEYVKILEAQSGKNNLLLRAGFGWKEGYVGHATVSAGRESQAGYTLLVKTPVIVANQATEERFQGSPLLTEHNAVSGISVIIEGHEGHWGVLGVHSIHPRTFTADDVYFVQSVANILGAAIERDRLDEVLEGQRQWLSNVIATVPGVIWENHHTRDQEEMKLIFISAYVETLLGYTVEEALAEPHFWSKIFHPEDAQKTTEAFNQIRKSKGSGTINFRAIHKDGKVVDVQALMTTVLQDDKPIGKRGVMMDVTERQNLMNAQLRYAAMLRRSNEELRQFAYVASHDLHEPLRMVVSYLQLLEDRYGQKLDGDAHDFINFAVDGAKRMRALITALLEYSRVEGGEKDFTELNMEVALRQALTNLTLKIEESHAQITYDVMPTIKGDQAQIAQLFQNLISNAIKFQKESAPQIHISVERKDQEWQIGVRDNGIGIAPEYLERIFIIFQRLHKQDQYPGTGIGLAICRKVVERHGGRIWVESTVGRGTTFYFVIPIISK